MQAPSKQGDQGDALGVVHICRNDLVVLTFQKNGISYLVQSLTENATSTLDILATWVFI